MAARHNAQTAGISGQRVEIVCNFDGEQFWIPAIGVPTGIPAVVVAIAGSVVKVVPQDIGGDTDDARVIEQRTELFAVIDCRHNHGPLRTVMCIAFPVSIKDVLKLFGNPSDLVRVEKLRNMDEPKGVEKVELFSVRCMGIPLYRYKLVKAHIERKRET